MSNNDDSILNVGSIPYTPEIAKKLMLGERPMKIVKKNFGHTPEMTEYVSSTQVIVRNRRGKVIFEGEARSFNNNK